MRSSMKHSTLERPVEPDRVAISRRRFLGWGIGAIAGFIGVGLGIPLVGYTVSPALKAKNSGWTEVGAIADFAPGQPKKVEFSALRKDGWIEETVKNSAWVVVQEGGDVVVFDPRCTHLGCAYRWDDSTSKFRCPCHDAVFDINGNVLSGPPPRPLDRLQAKVDGGKLMVMGG